eukprot:6492465-Amphidinium_carterae.3
MFEAYNEEKPAEEQCNMWEEVRQRNPARQEMASVMDGEHAQKFLDFQKRLDPLLNALEFLVMTKSQRRLDGVAVAGKVLPKEIETWVEVFDWASAGHLPPETWAAPSSDLKGFLDQHARGNIEDARTKIKKLLEAGVRVEEMSNACNGLKEFLASARLEGKHMQWLQTLVELTSEVVDLSRACTEQVEAAKVFKRQERAVEADKFVTVRSLLGWLESNSNVAADLLELPGASTGSGMACTPDAVGKHLQEMGKFMDDVMASTVKLKIGPLMRALEKAEQALKEVQSMFQKWPTQLRFVLMGGLGWGVQVINCSLQLVEVPDLADAEAPFVAHMAKHANAIKTATNEVRTSLAAVAEYGSTGIPERARAEKVAGKMENQVWLYTFICILRNKSTRTAAAAVGRVKTQKKPGQFGRNRKVTESTCDISPEGIELRSMLLKLLTGAESKKKSAPPSLLKEALEVLKAHGQSPEEGAAASVPEGSAASTKGEVEGKKEKKAKTSDKKSDKKDKKEERDKSHKSDKKEKKDKSEKKDKKEAKGEGHDEEGLKESKKKKTEEPDGDKAGPQHAADDGEPAKEDDGEPAKDEEEAANDNAQEAEPKPVQAEQELAESKKRPLPEASGPSSKRGKGKGKGRGRKP